MNPISTTRSGTAGKRDYDEESKDTPERRYSYDFDQVLRRYMLKTFLPFLPKGRAIEVGCYRGDFTELIMGHFDEYTVVDASQELIDAVRRRFGDRVRYITSTFEEMDVLEPYDAIVLVHTLEHLDEPVAVLKRINRWLAPHGRLFVAVPNANAPSRQIAVTMGLIDHNTAVTPGERQHGHRITYTLDTLERDARAAGLQVIHRGGVFFKPFANFQFDRLMDTDIISEAYLEGCYELGMRYPDLCASIYLICNKG